MGNAVYRSTTEASPLPKRIPANLKAQVSWIDSRTGKKISIVGVTEHIGESGALVNVEVLPEVGSKVKLRLFDEDKKIIETLTTVIRVERDPARPLAALSVIKNIKKWKDSAVNAAQAWVLRKLKLNYGEDWAN